MNWIIPIKEILFGKVYAAREAQTIFGPRLEIGQYIGDIYSWVLPIASAIAVILIVVSGYQILTSQGNDSVVSEAKRNIGITLGGLAMLLLIKILINMLIVNY